MNPAEIIGTHPSPLALSLYKEIVTNEIWNKARITNGYSLLNYEPLLYALCHQPYIDIRASLSSFIPADIDNQLADKLVNFQCEKLKSNPQYHDKNRI